MASGYTTPPTYALNPLIQPISQAGMHLEMPALDLGFSRVKRPSGNKTKSVTAQFDRLFSVSKIFFDHRFVELQEEVKTLRLSLFWKDHCCKNLMDAMVFANQKLNGPRCGCNYCDLTGRRIAALDDEGDKFTCKFQPYFMELLKECGLIHKMCDFHSARTLEHESSCNSVFDGIEPCFVVDIDAHIVLTGNGNCVIFTYGAKLWKETSDESAELKKLNLLFRKLYDCEA